MANQINFKVGYQVDKTALNDITASLQKIKAMTTGDLMHIDKTLNINAAKTQLKELRQSVSQVQKALNNSFNTNLGAFNISQFNQELGKLNLQKIYNDFNAAGAAGRTAFRNVTSDVLTTNLHLKQTNTTLDKLATTMANTVRWNITAGIINSITSSIQQAYGFAKDLDHSLNDIRIVSGKSADEMARFAIQANNAAKALASRTTDYTNASLIYYQQGKFTIARYS